jgi:hypothetical protein
MKAWIGKWLIFVSIGHTVVGIFLFGDIYKEMISDGLLGTVVSERTAAPAWFLLFGFLLFISSLLIISVEKHDSLNIPNSIALSLFILTTLGVILMPMSGFWLVYPAVIGIVLKNKRD